MVWQSSCLTFIGHLRAGVCRATSTNTKSRRGDCTCSIGIFYSRVVPDCLCETILSMQIQPRPLELFLSYPSNRTGLFDHRCRISYPYSGRSCWSILLQEAYDPRTDELAAQLVQPSWFSGSKYRIQPSTKLSTWNESTWRMASSLNIIPVSASQGYGFTQAVHK
jgi:hypothetical protein